MHWAIERATADSLLVICTGAIHHAGIALRDCDEEKDNLTTALNTSEALRTECRTDNANLTKKLVRSGKMNLLLGCASAVLLIITVLK